MCVVTAGRLLVLLFKTLTKTKLRSYRLRQLDDKGTRFAENLVATEGTWKGGLLLRRRQHRGPWAVVQGQRCAQRLLLSYGRRGGSPSAALGPGAVDSGVCWFLQVLLEGRHRDTAGRVRGGTDRVRCCSEWDGCSGLRAAGGKARRREIVVEGLAAEDSNVCGVWS